MRTEQMVSAGNQGSLKDRANIAGLVALDDERDESHDYKPLSREQAQALSQKLASQAPPLSLVRVLAWQAVTGLLLASCVWVWSGVNSMGWSVLYGSLCIVVPAAVFARGFGRQTAFGQSGITVPAGTAMAGFFIWELVKVALTVAMLLAAPRIVLQLDWLALLAGFVVTMKVYWVAAWLCLGCKIQMKK